LALAVTLTPALRSGPTIVKETLTVEKIDRAGKRIVVAKVETITRSTDVAFARKLAVARALIGAPTPWYARALQAVSPSIAHALITDSGETAIRDLLVASNYKFHGLGSGATAAAESDTGCQTEFTTQYKPDSTRATGSQTNNGADIYRTVGTNTVDATATARNFCLMSAATAGTMLTKIVFAGDIALASGDGVQTTYDLTIA
jgi:hypothetical protein